MADEATDLQACVLAYAAAVQQPGNSLRVSEAMIEARLALYDCLITLGWLPPDSLLDEIEQDRAVIRARTGAVGG